MDAGMKITSQEDVEKALKSIGFYRLRGYSFQLYDNAAKKYVPGTNFEDIIKLYQFDQELSALVFSMISKIEVALRVRLVEALLIHGEPLVLQDSLGIFLYERRRKMKIKIKEGFLLRKVAGDHVVVPVGEAGKVFHGMIRLNDTGAFLWEQCRKETTKEQVLQAMAEKYEVDESVAADDLDRFLQQLRNAEILEETNE